MSAKIYIVATPIGNLEDVTFRSINTLKSVAFIACEDTRVTRKLLDRYDIKSELISYHQHSSDKKMHDIADILQSGKDMALVTDAGTPGISDPGNKLIEFLLNEIDDLQVVPIPGPSAVIAALSVSGFPTDKFVFMGFAPHKKKRKLFFESVRDSQYTVVFYESCHRIKKALSELGGVLDGDRQVCVCRELTKKFESVYRGTVSEVVDMSIPEKGEFVVIVRSKKMKNSS